MVIYDATWSDEKNHRRCELIDKILSPDEAEELEQLQAEMIAYRRLVAPLPLERLREIDRELRSKK